MQKIPSDLKLPIVVSVFFLMVSCYSQQAQEVKTEIDINIPVDIPVIYNQKNPEPPPGVPSKISLEEELYLGYEKGKKGHFPSSVGSVAVDDEGNIFVFDSNERKIKVFDRNGQLVKTFGKFVSRAPYMHMAEGKTIMIYGSGAKRMYFYTTEGLYLKEISTEKYRRVLNPLIDSKGNIIAQFQNYKRRPRLEDTERTYVLGLRKMDPNFNPLLTIAAFEWTQTADQWRISPIMYPWFIYKVRKDDSIVWGIRLVNSDYELYISNPEGKEIKKIVKEYDPEKITKEDIKGRPGDWPENFPPFRWIACNKENEIYVQTYEKDENGHVFCDVFNPEGRYIAKFSLPREERIIEIKKNYIYTFYDEYKEIPYVKRYRVIWE